MNKDYYYETIDRKGMMDGYVTLHVVDEDGYCEAWTNAHRADGTFVASIERVSDVENWLFWAANQRDLRPTTKEAFEANKTAAEEKQKAEESVIRRRRRIEVFAEDLLAACKAALNTRCAHDMAVVITPGMKCEHCELLEAVIAKVEGE